jgi:prepilin-type N-terminal cleavage/methylation domain-containing protein
MAVAVRPGFTLIEVLVTIAIVAMLASLLLPAVQATRESARRTTCLNNVKQIALACLLHEHTYRHLPATGEHYRFSGDPDKGYGNDQPGGWHYNVLPFLDQAALREMGRGMTVAEKRAIGKDLVGRVVPVFVCPTRGGGTMPYRVSPPYQWWNIDRPEYIARSDYAACAGSRWSGWSDYLSRNQTGAMFSKEGLPLRALRDGTSTTYLLGERYLNAEDYHDGSTSGNDQGWTVGHDPDVIRWTDYDPVTSAQYEPLRDATGNSSRMMFGSPHEGFHMALCDGSVHAVSYAIDQTTHFRLGHRTDGAPLPIGSLP